MKNLKFIAIFILAAAVLSSCGGLSKMVKDAGLVSYQVTPEVLEMHGGEVDVTVDVNFPAKYFNKKAVVTLTPVVKYEGGEKELKPLVVQGEDATENYKVILYDGGGKASISNTFDYEDAFLRSELFFDVSASLKGKSAELGEFKLADGIIATPNLVVKDAKCFMLPDKFERIIPKAYEADIKYVINRADVRTTETRKDEIGTLHEVLKNTSENERLELKGLEISAYASPDGKEDFNAKLAENRKKSAEQYLSGQLKRSKISIADELFSMMSTPEDWEGFKRLMEQSDIRDKDMILRVLSMHSDPVVREREIRNLSAAFEEIADKILPQLRRSKFTVKMEKIGWSDEELADLWVNDPDKLTLEELLYTAKLFDDLKTKKAVYKKVIDIEPNCFRAYNNLAVVEYKMGNLKAAKDALNDAKNLTDNDVIVNNLGVIALAEGDVKTAKELFTASLGAGADVNYNLGIVNIIEGNYDAAINYFGNKPSFNNALAQYLNKNDDAAWRMIVNLPEETANRYYLMAVIAASQDKPDVVLENLRNALAVSEDPALIKDRALKDLEFAKLWNLPGFKDVLK